MDSYRELRERLISTVLEARVPDPPARSVPACPGWTVGDVLAHLTGICADVDAGRLGNVGQPDWTAEHLRRHGSTPVPELLDLWRTSTDALGGLPEPGLRQTFMDAVVHEHDIRVALEVTEPASEDDAATALTFLARAFAGWSAQRELPAVHAVTPARTWQLPRGEPDLSVTLTSHELVRTLAGRRTVDQARALNWSGDPDRWVIGLEWAVFRPPAVAVE